jgi:nucleoside-diphosphate-sugar epimerase
MRVLVTGLDGFTGRYVEEELVAHRHEVQGLASDLLNVDDLAAEIEEKQPDAVIHLAAIAFVGHGDPAAFYQVNVIGTRNLLTALASHAHGIKSVLLASSANVYGNISEGVLTEDTPLTPANDYAVSKLAMEYMARLWLDKLPLFMVRPFNYTGAGQSEDFLLPKIVGHFLRREPFIELGNLDIWRDFSDVRAIAEAYRRLIDAKPVGNVINICSGKTHSLSKVMAMAEEITGHKMNVRVNPAFVRANEVRSLCGDATRLRTLIGDWASPPLEETLSWMLEAKAGSVA